MFEAQNILWVTYFAKPSRILETFNNSYEGGSWVIN